METHRRMEGFEQAARGGDDADEAGSNDRSKSDSSSLSLWVGEHGRDRDSNADDIDNIGTDARVFKGLGGCSVDDRVTDGDSRVLEVTETDEHSAVHVTGGEEDSVVSGVGEARRWGEAEGG